MKGFKGFNRDLTCNGFQYKVGESYKHKGGVELCKAGFHFCEHPLDVLGYYEPSSRFAVVEGRGEIKSEGDKSVCSEIHIETEITLKSLIDIAVKFVFDRADWTKKENHATGYRGAASATGDSGAASATGDRGAASATGDRGAASATGDSGAASATGYSGAASVSGKHAIACGLGIECKARGAIGCWIVLAERVFKNNEWVIKSVKSAESAGRAGYMLWSAENRYETVFTAYDMMKIENENVISNE